MSDQAENRQEAQGSVSLHMENTADTPTTVDGQNNTQMPTGPMPMASSAMMSEPTQAETTPATPVVDDLNVQAEDLTTSQPASGTMSKRMWLIIAIAVGLLAIVVAGAIYALTKGNLFQGNLSLFTPAKDVTLEFDAPDKTFVEFTDASQRYQINWDLHLDETSKYDVTIYATKDGDTAHQCEVFSAPNLPGNYQPSTPLFLEVRNAADSCNLENGDYELTLDATLVSESLTLVTPQPATCQYSNNLDAIDEILNMVDEYVSTPGNTYPADLINRALDTAHGNTTTSSSHYSDDYNEQLLTDLGKLIDNYGRDEACKDQAAGLADQLEDLENRSNSEQALSLTKTPEAGQTFTLVTPDTTNDEQSNLGIVNPTGEIVAPATPNSEETMKPELQVFSYQENKYASSDFQDLDLNPYVLRGLVNGLADDANSLKLNGRSIVVNEGGDFCQELSLDSTENTLSLVAENKAGTTTLVVTVPHDEKNTTKNTDSCNQATPQPQVELQRFNGAAANIFGFNTNIRDAINVSSTKGVTSKTIKFKVNIQAATVPEVDGAEGGSDLGPEVNPVLSIEPLVINEQAENIGTLDQLTISVADGEFINSITPAMLDFSANTAPLGLSYTFASKSKNKLVLNLSASNHAANNSLDNVRITFDPTAITNTPDKLVTPSFAIKLIDVDAPQAAKPIVNVDLDKTTITDSAMPATASYNIDLDNNNANTAIVDLYLMANDNQAIFYLETDKKLNLGAGGTFETTAATNSERRILGTVDNTITGTKIANGTYVLRLNVKSVNGDPVTGLTDDTSLTIAFPVVEVDADPNDQGTATINTNTEDQDADPNDQGTATINTNTEDQDADPNDQGTATINTNIPDSDEDIVTPVTNPASTQNEPVVSPPPTIPVVTHTETTQFDNVVSVNQPTDRQVHPSAPDAQANLLNSPGVQGSTGPGLVVYPFMAFGSYMLARRRKVSVKK